MSGSIPSDGLASWPTRPPPAIVATARNPRIRRRENRNAVLLIAASLIAAVRLNREEIKSSPIVHSKIADSIRLTEMIQARLRRKDVLTPRSQYVSALRLELIARNNSYAALNRLPHVTSYGELPVVVYQQSECGRHHGNFISASYRAILRSLQWRKRLQKVHSQGRRSLPTRDGSWCELDSSLSSDALLMNIFRLSRMISRACPLVG